MHLRPALLCLLFALPATAASAVPQTARGWFYVNGNLQLSPSWSLTLMPGLRYELERSGEAEAKGHYLDELFVGPNWSMRSGNLGVRVSLWYYLLGYPRADSYPVSHNLEVVPTVDYQLGRLNLSYRLILHNTVYASVYPSGQRWGFGMVARNLVQAKLGVADGVSLLLGEEPWLGLVENSGTDFNSAGYWQQGLRLNRVYAGVDWKLGPQLSLSPQYVFETAFGPGAEPTEVGHYLYVTLGIRL